MSLGDDIIIVNGSPLHQRASGIVVGALEHYERWLLHANGMPEDDRRQLLRDVHELQRLFLP